VHCRRQIEVCRAADPTLSVADNHSSACEELPLTVRYNMGAMLSRALIDSVPSCVDEFRGTNLAMSEPASRAGIRADRLAEFSPSTHFGAESPDSAPKSVDQ